MPSFHRISRYILPAILLITVCVTHSAHVPIVAKGNLLQGCQAASSSRLEERFATGAVLDGLARGEGGDNGLIFSDQDSDQRLAITGLEGVLREIRLVTNTADAARVPAGVMIRGSKAVTQSLKEADYETELYSGEPLYELPVGDEPDEQIHAASIAVNAPEGTKSLLFILGPANGTGDRVTEVQGFASAPAVMAAESRPVWIQPAEGGSAVTGLGWDTESGGRARVNLLRADPGLSVQVRRGQVWEASGNGFTLACVEAEGGFDLSVTGNPAGIAAFEAMRLMVPFNPRISAVTVLPSQVDADSRFHLPAVVFAPGSGPMHVTADGGLEVRSTFEGSRSEKTVDWLIDLPPAVARGGSFKLSFRPLQLPAPVGLKDEARWRIVRRGWCNVFQISARWGDAGNPFSAPAGMLSNNVISDPVSCCLFIYADSALWTPELGPGVSAMKLVGHTLDWWLDKRMLPSGEIPGYWNLLNFLDANPSLLITAWDYFEATGDEQWLRQRIEKLEKVAGYLAGRDTDGDGVFEAVQSGNAGTLVQPARSCSAYDAVNCGHEDAYSNALAYRGLRCLAELEGRLERKQRQKQYTDLADRLKAGFSKELFNPDTGLIAWWKSADGKLHDYASPFITAMAVEYGLVDAKRGRELMARLHDRMTAAKFTRFDLGIPCTLIPVPRADYLLPDAPGLGKLDDGSDTFGQYLNGGILTGDSVRYLSGLYEVGEMETADKILDAMLHRLNRGDVAAGGFPLNIVDSYPAGGEFWTWDGKTCGYEGLLSHAYHFTQAVVMREPEVAARIHRPMRAAR